MRAQAKLLPFARRESEGKRRTSEQQPQGDEDATDEQVNDGVSNVRGAVEFSSLSVGSARSGANAPVFSSLQDHYSQIIANSSSSSLPLAAYLKKFSMHILKSGVEVQDLWKTQRITAISH